MDLSSQGTISWEGARTSLGRLWAVWAGLPVAVPRTFSQKGTEAAACTPSSAQHRGRALAWHLPPSLGKPITHLGA
jgi:hypothetical protein